ncbi:pharyngeal muscle protein 2-like [Bactrocera oleae]|uniref:pharyngeal muscle protein 2-like n=1 Tax=Bactrocera oleae TaxID=104688 RepID=UPI00387E7F76
MAKFNDLKIPQLKKELQKRGLATKGVKSKLQSRLRRAMEAKNINVEEYVFQSELEEETTKKQDKEVTQYSVEVICAALESFFEDFSAQLSASKELDVHMSVQLEEEEACEPESSQYKEQEACIPAQVSSQSEELNGGMPA